ncbi:hypothetical protein FISHEDRAFT_77551 [Fistulina hepatica ATCC 64428]|uniref:Uncharacterized protein n=1 Tax=Fistulina hepatica ATCC 64428 TaxID=1128425 RepID=A0A0D7A0N6_9AGAR|nr:hypothetical protein FISHEDRAFT_77551 [Fistulina hepatica ATCC 64428]
MAHFLPRRPSKVDTTLDVFAVAFRLARDISQATPAPYVRIVAGVGLVLIETVQTVRTNKARCMSITRRACQLINSVINVYHVSKTVLTEDMVQHIEGFIEVLNKAVQYLNCHTKGSFMRRFFQSGEHADLLQQTEDGLQHAVKVFGIRAHVTNNIQIDALTRMVQKYQNEMTATISSKLKAKPVQSILNMDNDNRSLLPHLPAQPTIFHGREEELATFVDFLLTPGNGDSPHQAIFGPAGIGKTAFALTLVHHQRVVEHFGPHRIFVRLETSSSSDAMVDALTNALGVKRYKRRSIQVKVITKQLAALAKERPLLLVLDGLDQIWERMDERNEFEALLSQITALKRVVVVVTMRCMQHPKATKWHRPFFPELSPLSPAAARQIFVDICEVAETDRHLEKLLALSGGLPWAVTLLAHLAHSSDCATLVRLWEAEFGRVSMSRTQSLASTLLEDGSNFESETQSDVCISSDSGIEDQSLLSHSTFNLPCRAPTPVSVMHEWELRGSCSLANTPHTPMLDPPAKADASKLSFYSSNSILPCASSVDGRLFMDRPMCDPPLGLESASSLPSIPSVIGSPASKSSSFIDPTALQIADEHSLTPTHRLARSQISLFTDSNASAGTPSLCSDASSSTRSETDDSISTPWTTTFSPRSAGFLGPRSSKCSRNATNDSLMQILHVSTAMALRSDKMKDTPNAYILLDALCLLPDGLSAGDLEAMAETPSHESLQASVDEPAADTDEECKITLPIISNAAACQNVVCHLALAYVDRDGRLRANATVRDYVRVNGGQSARAGEVSLQDEKGMMRHFYSIKDKSQSVLHSARAWVRDEQRLYDTTPLYNGSSVPSSPIFSASRAASPADIVSTGPTPRGSSHQRSSYALRQPSVAQNMSLVIPAHALGL